MLGTLLTLFSTTLGNMPVSTQAIQPQTEIITDFDGNEFILIEGDNTYEIYTSDNVFIEGSYSSNSPYYETIGEKYYLGPSNYFTVTDNLVTNIFTNSVASINDFYGYSYNINSIAQTRSSIPTPNPDRTYVDSDGFTVINEANYFRNLTNFPQNWFGECGIIALSELLSYYDTFYNDDFIPNNLTYGARYYVEKTNETRSSESSDYDLDRIENEPLARTVTTSYRNTDFYSFENWSSMPGTTYAMRDYIFDNYKHTFIGIGWPDGGYPMLDGELKSTLNDYMKSNCNHLIDKTEFKSGNLMYTHQRPKEYISEGLPTLLVLQSYDSSLGSGKSHVVVSYGYNGDKFLCHFGWWPGSTSSTEVVLNSATIYGYFTIKYNGEHKHSSNVSMSNGNVTKYICGCGSVHETHYSISPNEWGFDSRYYFENEGIRTSTKDIDALSIQTERLRCGYIEEQYINLSPNRVNAGYAYLDLSFNESIYQINTNLSFWSNAEGMNSKLGDYAYVKYLDDSGNWHVLLDLLNCNLSTNRAKQDYFELKIPSGTKKIRFEAYKSSPSTTRNKGRICIGNTVFVTKKDDYVA